MNLSPISDEIHFILKCHSSDGILVTEGKLKEALSLVDKIERDANLNRIKNNQNSLSVKNNDDFISKKNCPKCSYPMEHYEYMYSSGIMIDRCPNCQAIWLDKGKLTAIKRYLRDIDSYDQKIHELMPKIVEIKREVNNTFQKIKEDSNPYKYKS